MDNRSSTHKARDRDADSNVKPFVCIILALVSAFLIWVLPSKLPTTLLLIGAFLASLPRWRHAIPLWLSPAGMAALGVALFSFLSLLWSPHPQLAAREILKDLPLVLGLFSLSVWMTAPSRIEGALLASATVLALVFTADTLRLFYSLPRAELLAQARYFKPYWLTHPNTAGMLAVLTFWTGFYLTKTRWPSPLGTFGGLALAAISFLHLYLMGSRGPQAALAVSAFAALILVPASLRGRLLGALIASMLAVFVLLFAPRLNTRFALKDNFAGRTVVWKQTWNLTRERPWLGYGYGKKVFEKVYYDDAAPAPPSPHHFPHPHHYFLFALFQGGRIGLALRLSLWILLAWRLLRELRLNRPHRSLTALIAILLIALHCYGMADFPDSQAGMALLALIVPALVLTTAPIAPQTEEEPSRVT